MATIKALSSEIVIEILKAIPDLNSLHEAVHASPIFYRVYTASAADIYNAVTMQHLRDFPTTAYYYNPNGWFPIHLAAAPRSNFVAIPGFKAYQKRSVKTCVSTTAYRL